jgi:predicted ATPase
MKLKAVSLEGFRRYGERTVIPIDEFTAIIGKNDAGKSTILDALNIFFGNQKIELDDFTKASTGSAKIGAVFTNVPDEIVIDAMHKISLSNEHLLNADGDLEIIQEYSRQKAPKLSNWIKALHPTAEGYSDLLNLKQAALSKKCDLLSLQVAKTSNSAMRQALWDSCDDLKLKETLLSADKDDGGTIMSQLKAYLPHYFLFKADRPSTDQDAEAQDPMNAAVNAALEGVKTELDDVNSRVLTRLKALVNQTAAKLSELAPEIAQSLKPRISDPKWEKLYKISLTDEDEVPLSKRGSGMRRLVLLSFLQAKAEEEVSKGNKSASTIFAVEEPETNLHPSKQKELLETLQSQALESDTQVIITTHSPQLVRNLDPKQLRYITSDSVQPNAFVDTNDTSMFEKIFQDLGVFPDHRVKLFIELEGPHDVEAGEGLTAKLASDDKRFVDLRKAEEDQRVIFIIGGGSTVGKWVGKLAGLHIPEYHLYDRDKFDEPAHYQDVEDEVNASTSSTARHLSKRELENYLSPAAISRAYRDKYSIDITLPVTFKPTDDVPKIVLQKLCEYKELHPSDKSNLPRNEKLVKKFLNNDVISEMTTEEFRAADSEHELQDRFLEVSQILKDGTLGTIN